MDRGMEKERKCKMKRGKIPIQFVSKISIYSERKIHFHKLKQTFFGMMQSFCKKNKFACMFLYKVYFILLSYFFGRNVVLIVFAQ